MKEEALAKRSRNDSGNPSAKSVNPVRRVVLVGLLLIVAAVGMVRLVQASWQDTWRREAYLPDLEQHVRRHPQDGPALALYGARLAEINRYVQAAEVLELAIRAGVRHEAVWRAWASCMAAAGNVQAALDALNAALQPGGADNHAPIRLALEKVRALGDNPAGIQVAQIISPQETTELNSLFGRGSFLNGYSDYLASRNPEESGFTYRMREAKAQPDDLPVQLRWIEALRKNRRLRDAETVAVRLVQKFPDSAEAHLAYGDVLYDGGLTGKAGIEFRKALTLKADLLPALLGLGQVAVDRKLIAVAFECFEKATELAPKNADAWIGLGRAHANLGLRWDKALEAYEKAKQLVPERTDFYLYMSDALRAQYKPEEAETIIRARIADAPNDARAHYLLAVVLMDDTKKQDQFAEAEAALQESLRLENNAPIVKTRLARLLLDKEEDEAAADAGILLLESLDQAPNEIETLRLLARAYQRIGKPEKVREVQKQLVAVTAWIEKVRALEEQEVARPQDIEVHRQLAVLYAEGGEPEKAKRHEEVIYMLTHYPEQARKGVQTLVDATSRFGFATGDEKTDASGRTVKSNVKP
ncbi:MAG: hypothetical protein OHK0029_04910 [Armatimonadaceae bacterium]